MMHFDVDDDGDDDDLVARVLGDSWFYIGAPHQHTLTKRSCVCLQRLAPLRGLREVRKE